MRGLLEKDLRLLLQRKKALIYFVLIMIVMSISSGGTFMVSYGTMLLSIFAIGTQTYDEYENGVPFLLTLPVTRKEYVKEKFLFCGGAVLIGWLFSFLIGFGSELVRGNVGGFLMEWKECLVLLATYFTMVSVMIPLQIKYNAERSRMVLVILAGAVFALAAVVASFGSRLGIAIPVFEKAASFSDGMILAGMLLLCIGLVTEMYRLAVRVMEKKEY